MINFSKIFKCNSLYTGVALALLLGTSPVSSAWAQQQSSDPCPSPQRALSQAPDDLAKIQEDIDRFTLCVERAQLLERLNSLVEKNIETIDSVLLAPSALPALPVDESTGGFPGSSSNVMPVNEADLGPSDNSSFPGEASTSSSSFPGSSDGSPAAAEEEQGPQWNIREIYGTGRALQARLISTEGKIQRVKQGDILSDESRVIEVSKTRVKIKKDKEVIDLEWINSDITAGDE